MVKLFDLSKRGHSSPTSMTLNTNTNKEHSDIRNKKTDFKTTNYNVQHERRLMPLSSSESREPVSLSRLPNIQSIERHHKHSLPNSFLTPTKEQTCLLLTSNYVNCVNNMELEFLPSLRKDVDGVSRKTPTNEMHEYQEEQEPNCKSNFTKCKNNEFREARLHHYSESMSKEPNANKKVSNVDANINITTQIASQNFTQTSSQQLEQKRCNKIKQDINESEIHYEPHNVNFNERTVRSLQMRHEEMYNGAINAKCEPTLSSTSAQTSENFYNYHHILHEYLAMTSPLMTNNKQSQTPKSKEITSFSNNIISSSDTNHNSYGYYTNDEYNKEKENSLPAASISIHEHMIQNLVLQREKDNINSCNRHHSDKRNKMNGNIYKSNKKTMNKKMMNKSQEDKSEVLVSSQLCVCELPEMQNSSSQATSQSPFLTSSSLPPSHSSSFTPTPPSTTFTAIRASPFARSTSCEDSFLRSVSGHEMPMEHNVKKSSVNVNLEIQKCEHEAPLSRITMMEANQSCEEKHYHKKNINSSSSSIHEVHQVNSCKATSNATTKSYSVLHELMSYLQNALVVLNEQYVRIDNDTGEIVANNINEIKVEKIGSAHVTKETYVYVAKGNDDEVLPLL